MTAHLRVFWHKAAIIGRRDSVWDTPFQCSVHGLSSTMSPIDRHISGQALFPNGGAPRESGWSCDHQG